MTFDENEDVSIVCSVKTNYLEKNGTIRKTVSDSKTLLRLVRNEFRDIILKVESSKANYNYALKNMALHTRFIKEGKATIKLAEPNVQIFISNCPPNKLSHFMKMIMAKSERAKEEKSVNPKTRLLSDKARQFQEISPLTAIDVNVLQNKLNNGKAKTGCPETPKTHKRKRDDGSQSVTPTQKKSPVHRPLGVAVLTAEQKNVMSAVMSGQNVFFTGSAGTGKSFLLKRILGALAPDSTFATASTGVAACQIGGITLHAFAGLGSGTASVQQCIDQILKKGKGQQWKKCQHLVIDEVSMVDGEIFQKLERIARVVRNNDKPFGGIQLILTGDFLQLPPVCKSGETRKFCFQSLAWRKCVNMNIELTQVKRQKDKEFINMLQDIRHGRCSEGIVSRLRLTSNHQIDKDGILATRLSTHKDDVNFINNSKLEKLPGEPRVFYASDNVQGLTAFLNNHCPVGEKIELKVGAQVMLAKNMDIQRGLVNGARGVVKAFENKTNGLPIVKFIIGIQETISYEKWSVRTANGLVLVRKMLPLKLAWAISIHKSQGMTLDCVEVSLLRVFECGQAYVALSRARSLEGLRVLDIEPKNIRADPEVLKFYAQLRRSVISHQRSLEPYLEL